MAHCAQVLPASDASHQSRPVISIVITLSFVRVWCRICLLPSSLAGFSFSLLVLVLQFSATHRFSLFLISSHRLRPSHYYAWPHSLVVTRAFSLLPSAHWSVAGSLLELGACSLRTTQTVVAFTGKHNRYKLTRLGKFERIRYCTASGRQATEGNDLGSEHAAISWWQVVTWHQTWGVVKTVHCTC